MYIALKGFSGTVVSAYKNQVIEIKDKKVAKDLLEAGYIEEYSEKQQSTNEMKKEVADLKKQVETLESEKKELTDKNTNLEDEVKTLKETLEKSVPFNDSNPDNSTPVNSTDINDKTVNNSNSDSKDK